MDTAGAAAHREHIIQRTRLALCDFFCVVMLSLARAPSLFRFRQCGPPPVASSRKAFGSCCDAAAKGKVKLAWDSTAVWLKDENAHSQSAELAAGTVLQYQLKRLVEEAVQLA